MLITPYSKLANYEIIFLPCSSKVVGMHKEWKGGNMELYPGGGYKLNLLRKEIELVKNETDLVVMFTDRY